MTVNMQAQQLEKAIRDSGEFHELKELHEAVQKDDIARKTFDKFRDMQVFLQQKQMQGMEVTQEEIDEVERLIANLQQHEVIVKLMEAEHRMSELITEVNQIIMKPLEELYTPAK